jgi:hypothetical protein
VSIDNVVELDVTSAISGNGIYSFAMDSNNSNGAGYRSRENSVNPPTLVIITDGGGSTNTPPEIVSGPTATPNPLFSNETSQLSVGASDVDGDPLTYTWTVSPGEGTISGTGATVTYIPPAVTVPQTFTILVTVEDGRGGSDTGTVDVIVNPSPNTPPQIVSGPTATPNPLFANETAQLSVGASDADGDPLTYTWTVSPGEGTISGTGATVTYTPPVVTVQQTFTILVTVEDGRGGSDTGTVDVTVNPVGDEVTLTPVADTFVSSSKPNINYGSTMVLEVDGSPIKITYLRFDVAGLSGAVQSARLRLQAVNGSGVGGTLYSLFNNSWNENTVTYNTRPIIDGPVLGVLGPVSIGSIVEIDVTSAISGNGTYSFAIDSNSSNGAHYRSREDLSNPPVLIITTE